MKKIFFTLIAGILTFSALSSTDRKCTPTDYDFANKGRIVYLQNDNIDTNEGQLNCCMTKLNANCDVFEADTIVSESDKLAENALSAFLMDANSNTVVYSKNENQRLTIASMTKIMLLNLVFDAINDGKLDLNEKITVSETASKMGGSQVFLQANKEYLVSDLVKSIIVASANDASVALAEKLFGSEDACVEEMNKCRESMGLTNTLFSNCTGLPKPTQYSSAHDVAVMLNSLVKHEKYFEYSNIWLDELKHPDGKITTLTNTNKLVRFYKGCDGGKTGYTDESKFCLAGTSKRGESRIIAVVIGEPNSKVRFKEVSEMFDYCFNHYSSKLIVDKNATLDITIPVIKGKESKLLVVPESSYYSFCKKSTTEKFDYEYELCENIKAPVKKGESVGNIIVFKDGVEVARINAVAYEYIPKKTYFDGLKEVVQNWKLVR